jgi:flagellar protein FliO/FliZ
MLSDLTTVGTAALALSAVLGLIVLVARLARMRGFVVPTAARRTLAIEERLALDSRRQLQLVRCGSRRVLLLTGGGADVVVGWLPATGEAP